MVQEDYTVQLAGFGTDALNDQGKSFFEDGKNPYFGLVCGDMYVSDFKAGGMLILNSNIHFTSQDEKNRFSTTTGFNFGNIFSATKKIEKAAEQYHF